MHKKLSEMSINELASAHITDCNCGRVHKADLKELIMYPGAIQELPALITRLAGHKAFVYFDENTKKVAGDRTLQILDQAGIPHRSYQYPQTHLEPNNEAVGQLSMAFDNSCDIIIGVGSGTLNDLGKILASLTHKSYIIIATAPSMDGYASGTSSMNFDGVKISLNSKMADAIIADTDVLCTAPLRMFQSGFGDMVAKFISLCDWRIAHCVTGEYYCSEVAELVEKSLKQCMATADGILSHEPKTAEALMEGLTFSGLAMALAGVSRPASGIEHYFSHIWDMRSAAFGLGTDTHGLQCLIGSLEALKALREIQQLKPQRSKALAYAAKFDKTAWSDELRKLLGSAAEPLILLEEKEQKYAAAGHTQRLDKIISQWDEIQTIIASVLDATAGLSQVLNTIEAPQTVEDLSVEEPKLKETFVASKDIRDKYIISRLLWDIGELDELAERLYS